MCASMPYTSYYAHQKVVLAKAFRVSDCRPANRISIRDYVDSSDYFCIREDIL